MSYLDILGFARGLERVAAVVIGGLAIYFGYRLFQLIPTENDAKGSIKLPGFTVVLSKAGPGVFFAAFGAAVLITSYLNPVTLQDVAKNEQGGERQQKASGAAPGWLGPTPVTGPGGAGDAGLQAARGKVQLSIQVLNCLKRFGGLPQVGMEAAEVEGAVLDAKLALLRGVWGDDWGKPEDFIEWARVGAEARSGQPFETFSAQHTECPVK